MFKFMTKYLFIGIASAIFFAGCGDIDNSGENIVGNNFVSAEVIQEVDAATNLAYIQAGIDANATNAFAYKVVKIIYNTKDEQDKDVKASGILVIPTPTDAYVQYLKSLGKSFSISTILENHGTIFPDTQAPSNEVANLGSGTQKLALLMSGYAGFAAAMPDYIGYGESKDQPHPYILKKASARASVDMLKASMRYMTDNNIITNGQVYVSGYSEGGYVAMATAQDIEQNYSDEFKLKGVAPMDGPYDVKALGDVEINATHTMAYPAFLGYLTSAYSVAYDDVKLDDVLNSDINTTTFNSLFAGTYTNVQIHYALGMVTDLNESTVTGKGFNEYNATKLFSATFINDYQQNANNSVKVRLEENSVYDWKPTAKMNIIHCVDDDIIPFTMAQTAYAKFLENGATTDNITLSPIPTSYITRSSLFIHADCAPTAYGAAVSWFNKIRNGEIK